MNCIAGRVGEPFPHGRVSLIDAHFLERRRDPEEIIEAVRENAREQRFRMNREILFEWEPRLPTRFFARVESECRTLAILEGKTAVAPRLKRGTDQAGRVHVARAL